MLTLLAEGKTTMQVGGHSVHYSKLLAFEQMKWAKEFITCCFKDLEKVNMLKIKSFSDGEFQLGSRYNLTIFFKTDQKPSILSNLFHQLGTIIKRSASF